MKKAEIEDQIQKWYPGFVLDFRKKAAWMSDPPLPIPNEAKAFDLEEVHMDERARTVWLVRDRDGKDLEPPKTVVVIPRAMGKYQIYYDLEAESDGEPDEQPVQ